MHLIRNRCSLSRMLLTRGRMHKKRLEQSIPIVDKSMRRDKASALNSAHGASSKAKRGYGTLYRYSRHRAVCSPPRATWSSMMQVKNLDVFIFHLLTARRKSYGGENVYRGKQKTIRMYIYTDILLEKSKCLIARALAISFNTISICFSKRQRETERDAAVVCIHSRVPSDARSIVLILL